MEHLHLRHFSTGEPTYWPSDRNKLPDLLDFCVAKGIRLQCQISGALSPIDEQKFSEII
jgi:hypothetical protein